MRDEERAAAHLARFAGRVAKLGYWRAEIDAGTVVWSEETAQIHEHSGDRVVSLEYALSFYSPGDRAAIQQAFRRCVERGEPYDLVVRLHARSGVKRHVRAIGERDGGSGEPGLAVHGAFQDVSDLMQAREETQRLSNTLYHTLEGMRDAFFLLDRQQCFIYLNPLAVELLQHSRDELLGRVIWDVFPEAAALGLQELYAEALAGDSQATREVFFPAPSSWFEVTANPTPEGLAVSVRNIDRRKTLEAAASRNEERFRLLARATNDVIWDWDLRADRIWWNDAVESFSGYPVKALSGGEAAWARCVHPDDVERVTGSLHAVIASKGDHWEEEYRFLHADGRALTVIDRAFLVRDESGRAVRMLGSMVDVTERRNLMERVNQSQRLEAIGQLTGGVAHDFNNLLTVILGNTELLGEQLEDRPPLKALADMTVKAGGRAAELTSHLLAFARRQPLAPRQVDVNRLVGGMEGLLRRTVTEDIEIEWIRAGGLWPAEVDPGQLESAVLNLAINARDAMPDGGRLTIETANSRLDDDYAATNPGAIPGQYVMVSVSDTGSGMTADVVAHAFEPFFTTKPAGKGSGLGLSMVYGFVKQSGGFAKIYTELGEGSTVRLYFPRASARDEAASATAPELSVMGGSEHVLVVEDDALVREHVVSLLQGLGYRVSEAASGEGALQALARSPTVDLLFTDVVMPGGMSGRQLAEEATRRYPGLKVLYTSGYTENAIVHQGRLDQGVQLLSKPYRRQQLALKVRKVLDDQGPRERPRGAD